MENKRSPESLTAICAGVVGVSYCLVGLTHFLMPRENLLFAKGISRAFFESLTSGSTPFSIHYWAFICASLFGMGVVWGFSEMFRSENSALLKLSSVWGIIGLAVTALNFGFLHHQALATADRFASLDSSVQMTIVVMGFQNLDPYSLMGFGLVGIWSLTVNLFCYRRSLLPKALALVGCGGGMLYEMAFLGTLSHSESLIDFAAAGAIILGPVWFIWLGLFLLGRRPTASGRGAELRVASAGRD